MAKNSKFRFTIIEIILVLAVAGLIALVVFMILPAFQQSQDEVTRRNDISLVYKSLVQYQTDNSDNKDNLPHQGSYIASESDDIDENTCNNNSACKFVRGYINTSADGDLIGPDGVPYNIVITSNYSDGLLKWDKSNDEIGLVSKDGGFTLETDTSLQHTIFIVPGSKCEGSIVKRANRRHFAILYLLEKDNVYCLDDQQ